LGVDIDGWSGVGKQAFLAHLVRLIGGKSSNGRAFPHIQDHAELYTLCRINWSGAALAAFYAAVRQALVVAIIIRALATAFALGGVGWWVYQHWYSAVV
jgi:hypothetical protein